MKTVPKRSSVDDRLPDWLQSFLCVYDHYVPYLKECAYNIDAVLASRSLAVKIHGVDGYLFDPLYGCSTSAGLPTVTCTKAAFLRLFAPDLSRYDQRSYLVQAGIAGATDVSLHRIEPEPWRDFLSFWFRSHELASTRFFESKDGVLRYFSSPKTVSEWWTKGRVEGGPLGVYSETIRERIGEARGVVLDAGAGYGRWAAILKYQASLMAVTDASSDMLCAARSLNGQPTSHDPSDNIVFVKSSLSALPFGRRTFDSVIALQLSMHLPRLHEAMKEVVSTMKEDGRLLMDFSCFRRPNGATFTQKSPITRVYDERYVTNLINDLGITIIQRIEYPESDSLKWIFFLATVRP